MNLKTLLIALLGLVGLTCIGLTIFNPTLAEFRESMLTRMAEQEVNQQEQTERQAIEREAAALRSYFSAVRYDGSRLDIVLIQKQYPRLGATLASQHAGGQGATLNERLAQVRQRALQRMTVTRETTLYSLLADLSAHTTRISYGLWSRFATCHNDRLAVYLGIAGHFHEEDAGTCLSPR